LLDGVSIRTDVLSTDDKGEQKESVQKRTTKILQKLCPVLQRILLPGETILYAMTARSPLSIIEQVTAAWWTALLAACVVVVTNKRLLFLPVKRDGNWRRGVPAEAWGKSQAVKRQRLLVGHVTFKCNY